MYTFRCLQPSRSIVKHEEGGKRTLTKTDSVGYRQQQQISLIDVEHIKMNCFFFPYTFKLETLLHLFLCLAFVF